MSPYQLLCVIVLLSRCGPIGADRDMNNFNFNWYSFLNSFNKPIEEPIKPSTALSGTKCVGCDNKLDDEAQLEEELTALRIEYIKHQILKKLRLKEKPTVSFPINGLPKPLTEDEHIFPINQENEIMDHYYGKTTQAIIFPSEG